MRIWQAATALCWFPAVLWAGELNPQFKFEAPKVPQSLFTQELGMLGTEREDYATNLATFAANQVAAAKASAESLAAARRMLGLALHLSPRNKKTLVVSFQMAKGVMPEVAESNYSPQVFSRLLVTRGQLLAKQGGTENELLARLFTQLAAEIDPKNEDAVYASEMNRLDHGEVDWSVVTDPPKSEP
jgi:hypothetical protein